MHAHLFIGLVMHGCMRYLGEAVFPLSEVVLEHHIVDNAYRAVKKFVIVTE